MKSSSDSELFAWIKEQESAGGHDSHGQFTISASAAWEKMGAFSLPFEHAWVLKLAQSAVRAGVDLVVTQTRTETTFEWGEPWRCCAQQLEPAIFKVEAAEVTALSQLGIGIRALARSTRLPFSIGYSDGLRAIWSGEAFMQVADSIAAQATPFRVVVSHFLVGEAAWLFSLDTLGARSRAAAIAQALTSRCHWAPTRISLDGREITNIFLDPNFGSSSLHQPMFILRAPAVSESPALNVRARFRSPEVSMDMPGVVMDVAAQLKAVEELARPSLAIGLVSMFLEQKGSEHRSHVAAAQASQIVWIQDGVEVSREEIPIGKGMAALLVACGPWPMGSLFDDLLTGP